MKFWQIFWPPSEAQQLREKIEHDKKKRDEAKKKMSEDRKYKGKIPTESEVFYMIRENLPKFEEEKKTRLQSTINEHEEDCKNFFVDFTRWGDFLHVNIYRHTPEFNETRQDGRPIKSESQSIVIPLFKVSSISFTRGKLPECSGKLEFYKTTDYAYEYWADFAEKNPYQHQKIHEPIRNKFVFEIPEPALNKPYASNTVHTIKGSWNSDTMNYSCSFTSADQNKKNIIYTIDQYPCYAVDDVITFHGVGKLNTPGGMGQPAHDNLLKVLQEGYENFYINKQSPKRK